MHLKHKLKNPAISPPFELNARIIALPSKNTRKKYTHENHLNSSDQLYMQRTNKQTNKQTPARWLEGGRVGAEGIRGRGEEGDDDTEILYSRAGGAAAAPGAAFACSVIAGRHRDGLIDEHKKKF
jgi:hypothetical protein